MTRKSAESSPTSPRLHEPFWLDLARVLGESFRDVVNLLLILAGFGVMLGIVIVIALFVVRVLT